MKNEEKNVKKVNEEEEIEELQDELKIIKKKDLKKGNDTIIKIFNITFWVIIFVLFAVWIIDFTMVKLEKNPVFCVSKKTHNYEDGNVKECTGLGYKVYQYNLTDKKTVEFSPFYSKMDIK